MIWSRMHGRLPSPEVEFTFDLVSSDPDVHPGGAVAGAVSRFEGWPFACASLCLCFLWGSILIVERGTDELRRVV